jgi:drug/metabolite transporter (DMT)-like permease
MRHIATAALLPLTFTLAALAQVDATKTASPQPQAAEMSGYSVLTMQMAWGLLFAVPMVLAEWFLGGYSAIAWSPKIYSMILFVALGPALLAYLCYQQAVLRTGSQLPMFFLNLTPVFAALMAVVLLGEFPELYHGVGLVLIVAGIVLANPTKKSV